MPWKLRETGIAYTRSFQPEPPWTYKSVADSKMWVIPPLGKDRVRLDDNGASDYLADVRAKVTEITGLALEEKTPILAIWRFDKDFPKCPVHIDEGGEHTGSIVTCINGEFKLHLHAEDAEDSPIIETVEINSTKLIALNNTEFPHSVEGQGNLIVFGTAKETNTEEYFKNV